MIDVMKRLAELDKKNPTIVKENQQVEECGIMPEMGMMGGMPERPPMPASINMTAGSGEELSDMLATIMQLAGVKQHGAEEPMGAEPAIALTAEPEMGAGDPTSDMRSMIDKLNPMDGDDQGPEQGPEQGGNDDVSAAHGDIDNDGDHDMDDHEAEKDEEETDEGQYDNSPSDPRKPPPFGANQFANKENQPGQGDRMDGNMPKATMEQQLLADYRDFVSEGKPSAGMSKGEKSSLVKKAKSGKDIGKPGKSFDKVAAKAGGGEKGKKIAAAAMWKNAAK